MAKPDFARIDAPAEEFCFQLTGDKALYRLPAVNSLPLKTVRALMGLKDSDDADAFDKIIDVLDCYCEGLSDRLTLSQFEEVLDAWFAASGVTQGE